ncbi:NUDIX hydrolase [Frankia sp. CIT1]|uniref:NUDIX hydrolase n=1 Tax=Frankia sp. CIT1 TaxID=2880974 RepID=UPI001EF5F569|nr:NUDIX domain-containing protein [Frankia sp. CIT1]
MSGFDRVITGVTTVVPGPGDTVTFIRQARGPYAGSWLLPGGKVEFGESLAEAARREVHEESGCIVRQIDPLGVYELRGTWPGGRYHLIMFGFISRDIGVIPGGFTGHGVNDTRQARPEDLPLHPAVQQMLVDAGVAAIPQDTIDKALDQANIDLARRLITR